MNSVSDTITAVASGSGGAIAIIRISGPNALKAVSKVFKSASGKDILSSEGYSLLYGDICDGPTTIDNVLATVFRTPRSYTGEDMVEISCHGSLYVQQKILDLLTAAGAVPAQPGEFTMRAFLNGKMDLTQAEAVADIIASESEGQHRLAVNQMRGGFAAELRQLRSELIKLSSLLELELDFSEEEVEFADRSQLAALISLIRSNISELVESFRSGNAIKNGISVAIVGSPNVGKSTLLNRLLKEDRAMVSEIAGTTRDVVEDSIILSGIKFRFLDTAGLRQTDDPLELMGIDRTLNAAAKADIIIYVVDKERLSEEYTREVTADLQKLSAPAQQLIIAVNKDDRQSASETELAQLRKNLMLNEKAYVMAISAKNDYGVDRLTNCLEEKAAHLKNHSAGIIISNIRHYEALISAGTVLDKAIEAIVNEIPSDLLAQEIREAVFHLGTITGEITNDEILASIFGNFCIGK